MRTQWPKPLPQSILALALLMAPLLAIAESASSMVPPGPGLTLEKAVALALEGNPRLQVFSLEVRAREALVIQAGLKPNPELSFEVENLAGSGDFSGLDGSEMTLSVGQLMERGGKRARRTEVAELNQDLAGWDYQSVRLDVLADVARAFVSVAYAQERLALSLSFIEVAQQDLAAVKSRVQAGSASPIELTRAEVALATAQLDQSSRTIQLASARNSLAATWGGGSPTIFQVQADFERIMPPPPFAILSSRISENPDLARWQTELAQGKATLSLAQAMSAVDLTAMVGLRRLNEPGDNAAILGLSVPLKFHNKNQGNIRAAEYRLEKALQSREATAITAQAAAKSTYAQLTAAFNEVTSLRNNILPKADEASRTAYNAYQKGLFNFTDVLAVRLNFFQLQERNLDALARFHAATADLERLVAGPFSLDETEQE